jgi:hypothetical protein
MSDPGFRLPLKLLPLPVGIERRATVRHLPDRQTSCHMTVGLEDRVWPATVRNLSENGIGLHLGQSIAPGTLVAVELRNRTRHCSRTVLAVVIHAQKDVASGGWIIGCEFASTITAEELQAFCESTGE